METPLKTQNVESTNDLAVNLNEVEFVFEQVDHLGIESTTFEVAADSMDYDGKHAICKGYLLECVRMIPKDLTSTADFKFKVFLLKIRGGNYMLGYLMGFNHKEQLFRFGRYNMDKTLYPDIEIGLSEIDLMYRVVKRLIFL